MKEQSLNKRQVAKKCNLYEQQIGQYVLGKSVPSYNLALKIIETLDWTLIPTFKQKENVAGVN